MKLLSIIACFLLASCGNLKYLVETYKDVEVQKYDAPEMSVRIFDRADLGRMMVTPTVGRGFAMGAAAGATHGIWTPGLDPFPYQTAAQHYLDSGKRNATITSGRLLVKPQWEFMYTEERPNKKRPPQP